MVEIHGLWESDLQTVVLSEDSNRVHHSKAQNLQMVTPPQFEANQSTGILMDFAEHRLPIVLPIFIIPERIVVRRSSSESSMSFKLSSDPVRMKQKFSMAWCDHAVFGCVFWCILFIKRRQKWNTSVARKSDRVKLGYLRMRMLTISNNHQNIHKKVVNLEWCFFPSVSPLVAIPSSSARSEMS